MMTQQVVGQIGFSEYLLPAKQINPQFLNGQPVFVRSLDAVMEGIIERSWLCGEKTDSPYYGYSVDFPSGLHTVFQDCCVGNTAFACEEDAVIAAQEASKSLVKIDPKKLELLELKSYVYIRELDNHVLTATLAKVGENQIYEHSFMCYHFLRSYPNKGKRDKEYRSLLSRIAKESEERNARELYPPVLDTLYRVNESLYASREFAKRNLQGAW